MKGNNILITVTNNFEGGTIERYIDTICSNVVVGTNVFSDFAASFTDFFGGFSDTYKNKLELIYNEAIKELKGKASLLGANAIVGFNIDFDEISGGNKSMFMVSVSGTACIVNYQEKEIPKENSDIVYQKFIDFEIERRKIIKSINEGAYITKQMKEFLYENPQTDIATNLIDRYIRSFPASTETETDESNFIENYLKLLPKTVYIDYIYTLYVKKEKGAMEIIKKCGLFSPSHILEIAKNDIHLAIKLFDTQKESYNKEDLNIITSILAIVDSLPDTGRIELIKGGLLSKEQEKYICMNGHKNKKDVEFCESCGVNIKGLHHTEVQKIERLRERAAILFEFL